MRSQVEGPVCRVDLREGLARNHKGLRKEGRDERPEKPNKRHDAGGRKMARRPFR